MIGFAKKIGMTRIFVDGKFVPVTALLLEDNYIIQTKTEDKDKYKAVQLAAFEKKDDTDPVKGHFKKYLGEEKAFHCLGEFQADFPEDKKVITIEDFEESGNYKISGLSMGRGFAGAVKRWGFAGQPRSHGHDHVKAVGSIGGRWPQRVPKGKKMAGRYGSKQTSVKNSLLLAIDKENKLLFVKGSVPGSNQGFLKVEKV